MPPCIEHLLHVSFLNLCVIYKLINENLRIPHFNTGKKHLPFLSFSLRIYCLFIVFKLKFLISSAMLYSPLSAK